MNKVWRIKMNIIFLRHGEASDNVNELFSDKEIYWSTLTVKGINTVKETIKNLPNSIDKIYVSPLPRTIQTAHYVSNLYPETEVIIENRIREINHGKYTHQKNNENLDNTRKKQINGDYFIRLGEYGENNYEIENRLNEFLKEVSKNNFKNNTIMIISHGSITSYMKRILKLKTPHIQTGKMEIFNNINFKPLFESIKKLSRIRKEKIDIRINQIKNLNVGIPLKQNLLKLAKKEFNNNEISDQIFNSYIEGLSTKTLIQVTSPVFKKGIILICFYNNFENITEVWMQHYINIGIKNFVLVDKNSQDKSTEILKKYSKNVNISFWKINENFNDSNQSGLQQKIVEFYGADNFYLFVEPYELLIYKNFEKINIDKYIQKMKVSIFKSLVLDVYPNKNIKNPSFRDFKYIDNNTYKITSQRYGQKFYGGPYLRVLKTNLCLQKISLIKYTGKEIFINKHFYYPFSLNNKAKFCTYLLNYNLLKETNKKERIIFYDKKTSKLLSDLI